MVSLGSYILSAVLLAALVLSLGFSAVTLRRLLMPEWTGAPARLVESIVGVALLIWLSELLGVFDLFYAGTLVAASVLVAAALTLLPRVAGGRGPGAQRRPLFRPADDLGRPPTPLAKNPAKPRGTSPPTGPAGGEHGPRPGLATAIAVLVVAVVFAHWGLTVKDALDRGIFNFDSLWYHLPFAVEMAHSHSVTGIHYTETVFTNWFYPQNSELLHAVGILLTGRDTLSLFLNFGWLAMAFLAAWCIGRPYGRGPLAVTAAAVLLECHTLVVREPGAAKNDLMAAALLLAAIAILVNGARKPGWPLAAAGLAVGLAVGTKSTALAMAAVLTLAVIVLAPAGRRRAAAGWWFAAGLAGGGYWYLRNLVISGNPLPQLERLGPISLPHPERLQEGRPDFSIAHYATDTGVWRHYFAPGLHQAFGALWPIVLLAALVGALAAIAWGRPKVMRWMGAVALVGMVAYVFTPLSAAGAEGAPTGFAINIRYAIPALLAGVTLLPASLTRGRRAWSLWDWALMGALLLLMLVTDRSDAALRDPGRLFAWGLAFLLVLIPAAIVWVHAVHRKRSPPATRGRQAWSLVVAFIVLALAVLALGYPVQRDYLRARFANENRATSIPGMHLDSAYRWARGVHDARIGLAGTTAGFLEYGFYGTDLSNRVRYLGEKAPHGGYDAIPTCARFRAAANAADLDYLVTAPFLNFIEPGHPVPSPEARWLRGEPAVTPVLRSGPVTVWRIDGRLDPATCGPRNAPLREVPNQPHS